MAVDESVLHQAGISSTPVVAPGDVTLQTSALAAGRPLAAADAVSLQ
jgi:hypothetical protein